MDICMYKVAEVSGTEFVHSEKAVFSDDYKPEIVNRCYIKLDKLSEDFGEFRSFGVRDREDGDVEYVYVHENGTTVLTSDELIPYTEFGFVYRVKVKEIGYFRVSYCGDYFKEGCNPFYDMSDGECDTEIPIFIFNPEDLNSIISLLQDSEKIDGLKAFQERFRKFQLKDKRVFVKVSY